MFSLRPLPESAQQPQHPLRQSPEHFARRMGRRKRLQRDPICQGLNPELEKVLLAEIAYEGFVADQLFFPKQQLINRIRDFLADTVDNPKYLDSAAVLNAIAVQQGILVERAEAIFSFSHLGLQEYLTALHISQNYRRVEQLVKQYLTEERWKEVFIMVAGLLGNANEMLSQMDAIAQQLISNPKLQILLQWADHVTREARGNCKSLAKRAVAMIIITIAIATHATNNIVRAIRLANISAFVSNSPINFSITMVNTSFLSHSDSFTISNSFIIKNAILRTFRGFMRKSFTDIASDLASANDLASASELEEDKIFKDGILTALISGLEELQSQIPDDDQPHETLLAFADRIEQTYLDAFQIKREWLELSDEEVKALVNYFCIYELMVRCKEAAVRVSRETWAAIEGRMLLPQPTPTE